MGAITSDAPPIEPEAEPKVNAGVEPEDEPKIKPEDESGDVPADQPEVIEDGGAPIALDAADSIIEPEAEEASEKKARRGGKPKDDDAK